MNEFHVILWSRMQKADIFQPSFAQLLVDFVSLEKLITKELREVFPVFFAKLYLG